MKTDWYENSKPGTYVAIPAGTDLASVTLPEDILSVLDVERPTPYATNEESQAMALTFDCFGIEDCLKRSGYSVLRS